MARVTLTELTRDNWEAVAALDVHPHQQGFVASNLKSIAETQFYPWARRRVILADGFTAGFIVHGTDPESGEHWLHRFMVMAERQGQGIGREAMRMLVDEWNSDPEIGTVLLSYEPENAVAEKLYSNFGFVPGEIAEWGERIARLTFPRKAAASAPSDSSRSEPAPASAGPER
jgi:diamine N-acetyltransferase